MAAFLRRRGLLPGERVGIILPNVPEYLIALFGTWMAGGVVVPINPLMVEEEVRHRPSTMLPRPCRVTGENPLTHP